MRLESRTTKRAASYLNKLRDISRDSFFLRNKPLFTRLYKSGLFRASTRPLVERNARVPSGMDRLHAPQVDGDAGGTGGVMRHISNCARLFMRENVKVPAGSADRNRGAGLIRRVS